MARSVRGRGQVSEYLVPVIENQNRRGSGSVGPWKEKVVEAWFLQAVHLPAIDGFLPVEVFL